MQYNEDNLSLVSGIIVNHLTPDLLPKKYIEKNMANPTFGHCHTASACLQKVFGTKELKLYRAKDSEDIWHWWCVDTNSTIIDLTADQYYLENKQPPYKDGTKASILGWKYKARVLKLYERVNLALTLDPILIHENTGD